jgi:hypothetical protein
LLPVAIRESIVLLLTLLQKLDWLYNEHFDELQAAVVCGSTATRAVKPRSSIVVRLSILLLSCKHSA